ncbi:MAG: chromate efflux transporter [Alphaproteobacteria bacterium]
MTITFPELTRVFAKIGLLSFGGPAGQIALMHRMLVDEQKWLGEEQFLRALNFCMLLPGPEAHQLAVYSGWLLHGVRGGLMAGFLFLLPGVMVVLTLSSLYFTFQDIPAMGAVLMGLKAAVLAIVIEALVRIGKKALTHRNKLLLAGAAFFAIFFLAIPFPLIVLGAAGLGALGRVMGWPGFRPMASDQTKISKSKTSPTHFFRTLALGLLVWLGPLAVLSFFVPDIFRELSILFTKLAVVTFGGAYAVLAYLAQEAVGPGWLTPAEMIDGLGLAETTPGPLILVVDFVGYIAGARSGGLGPFIGGLLGTLVAVWATFVPSFLWIFLGAPWIERIKSGGIWDSALSGVTAAVTGVILNLALWFGLHVLFGEVETIRFSVFEFLTPTLETFNGPALLVFALAIIALFRFHIGVIPVILGSVILGLGIPLVL